MPMTETPEFDPRRITAAITRRAAGRPRTLVGIDGPGAAGKSTLAGLLRAGLEPAAVVQVDDFYLPSAVRGSRAGEIGALFDLPRLASQVVLPAAAGCAFRYQRYDWDTDTLTDWVEVPAAGPVIIEGVYCLQRQFRDAYTFAIFCQADAA